MMGTSSSGKKGGGRAGEGSQARVGPPVPASSPTGTAAPRTPTLHRPLGTREKDGNKQGWHRCSPAPHPATAHPLPPRGPPGPSGHPRCPGGGGGGQRISPPAAARTTRGKVRKVIPSPCVPMPATGTGRDGQAAPPRRPVLLRSAPGRAAAASAQAARRNPPLQPVHCC